MKTCDIAIIGAGTAGLHAYKAARAAGADVVVIERGPGGSTCTRSGCIPSKLLIAAARAAHHARGAGRFGIDTGDVRVEGTRVLARLRADRDRRDAQIRDELLAIPPDHRLQGEARFTGPATLRIGDETVRAGAIIVATGARPQVPPPLEPVRDILHTHESIFEIAALPASLAVVGAGPLGLELAQAFARLDVEVTVLDKSEQVGAVADPHAERALREALSRDFAIHLGVEVEARMAEGQARLSWGGESPGVVAVDMVLAATGRAPDLAPLGLEAAGLALDEQGVPRFDPATRRCGDSAVFIAGDAGGWHPVLHEAARGGRIAGSVAAGGAPWRAIPSLAIAFTDPGLAVVGIGFDDLPEDAVIGCTTPRDDARSGIDAQEDGLVRLYADRRGRLLGGTIVAADAEHLGQILALAIDRGMDAATFADQAWYHPVTEEMLQAAARDVMRQAGHGDG